MVTTTKNNLQQNTEVQVKMLYGKLLESWNNRSAKDFAGLFADDGSTIGFDGTQANSRYEIQAHLSEVFNHHKTSSYVSIVRDVRSLDSNICILRAVAGMIPPGKSEINPKVNAIQTLLAIKNGDQFRIVLFQNTPAAFDGRPELAKQLTEELQQAFDKK